ncbi:outer membrane beta-barrel protein [Chitinophagaceae bacterium 26-R-25]|nr:outer membrane beta-barrel protein [Chitinophagaceae bacterium 26-R-25]
MHKLYLLLAALCITTISMAQADSTRPQAETTKPKNDTIVVGGMVIIRTPGDQQQEPEKHNKKDFYVNLPKKKHNANLSTNWLVFDFGFNNMNDQTNYSSPAVQQLFSPAGTGNADWFDLRNGKSVNVNIWFFMQRLNLVQHILNLKYGLGLELYNFRYSQPVRFDTDPTNGYSYYLDRAQNYSKNKLATDYLAVPVMLNFNFTPGKKAWESFGLSAGVSMGYLYSSRQKVINEQGKNKIHNNFDLEQFKLSYIAELQLGFIKLYGSYASKSIFKNGINQTPYAIGVRFSNQSF